MNPSHPSAFLEPTGHPGGPDGKKNMVGIEEAMKRDGTLVD